MKRQYLLLMVLSSFMMMIFLVVNIQLRDEGSLKYLEFMKQLSLNIFFSLLWSLYLRWHSVPSGSSPGFLRLHGDVLRALDNFIN